MKDTWNMTPDEAKKYILQNWFDGDESVNAFVCGDEEYTAMAIAVEALEATKWHYPSKGEYPILQGHYLVCVKDKQGDLFVVLAQYVDDVFIVYPYEVVAWMPLPEPPKEEA